MRGLAIGTRQHTIFRILNTIFRILNTIFRMRRGPAIPFWLRSTGPSIARSKSSTSSMFVGTYAPRFLS